MDKLKVCFIGVGSIAKRHIKNLQTVCADKNLELQIDAFRREGGKVDGIEHIYTDTGEMPYRYNVIFITNPTELHLDALRHFHSRGEHFFIEKPVVSLSQIEIAEEFERRNDSVYYVACPLRYNAVIQYIKKYINPDDVISIRSISSSYLPSWRPGQDYRETYSAHKDMGGGVSMDLIHEWDYITYLFGWPKKIYSMIGKKSPLEIYSDDYAVYIAEFADKIAELHLDYFGRKTIREIQLITKEDTIVGDIANNKIEFLCSGKEIHFNEDRDDYQKKELSCFLNMIQGNAKNDSGFIHGLKVLGLTKG